MDIDECLECPGKFVAIAQHRSEYPHPITFQRGDHLVIGDKYEGPEGWNNWYLCSAAGQVDGWVPGQVIERLAGGNIGVALSDYTARELDVNVGDVLVASKSMNGWMWCKRLSDDQSGWVPTELLEQM